MLSLDQPFRFPRSRRRIGLCVLMLIFDFSAEHTPFSIKLIDGHDDTPTFRAPAWSEISTGITRDAYENRFCCLSSHQRRLPNGHPANTGGSPVFQKCPPRYFHD